MGASTAEFILVPDGSATKVTWTLDSKLSGMGKIFGPLMDGMVGPDYEKGLKNLKKYVENLSPGDAKLDSIK
jgi:carbon monoxide dehydrogenase subunit G